MRIVKRILIALGVAALVGAIVRLRGRGGSPPSDNGWRELEIHETT